MIRRRSAFLVLPLVLGGLVACGGDDDSGSDTETTAAVTTVADDTGAETTVSAGTASEDTTTGDTSDGTVAEGSEEFCGQVEELANFNAVAPELDATGDWATVKDELLASAESALPLYDDVIAAAPDEVSGNLETLKDYTDEVLGAIEESDSAEDFLSALSVPSQEVLTATEELDTYLNETCGFGLTQRG